MRAMPSSPLYDHSVYRNKPSIYCFSFLKHKRSAVIAFSQSPESCVAKSHVNGVAYVMFFIVCKPSKDREM